MRWLALPLLLASLALPARAQDGGAARLGSGDQSSEYWDLTALFSSGHRLLVRFSISNEGPGKRTGYALGQVLFPDGTVAPFQNGRLEDDWELSSDRLRLEIGSSVLDLSGPESHFEVDKNKKGMKVFLDFPRDATIRHWRAAPRGLALDLVALAVPVRGSIWVRDVMGAEAAPVPVEGRATLTHAWMDESEPELARRRIETHLLAGASGDYAYLVETLPVEGEVRRWALARAADGSMAETDDFALQEVGAKADAPYPVPTALKLSGPALSGRIELGPRVVEHDPLDAAPRPFRWLLSFRTRPRQTWLSSRIALEWKGEGGPGPLAGSGLTSFYFMNPMER